MNIWDFDIAGGTLIDFFTWLVLIDSDNVLVHSVVIVIVNIL